MARAYAALRLYPDALLERLPDRSPGPAARDEAREPVESGDIDDIVAPLTDDALLTTPRDRGDHVVRGHRRAPTLRVASGSADPLSARRRVADDTGHADEPVHVDGEAR